MNPPSLPALVSDFIQREIHSVLQLEILLLLRERGGAWQVRSVADELRISEQSAELHLGDLRASGLVAQEGPAHEFVFAPRSAELAAIVDQLAECYATMRYTVINLIFAVPGDSARTLAEAFRFRKKRDG